MQSVARYPHVLVLVVAAAAAERQPQQREINVFLTVADTMASPVDAEHIQCHRATGVLDETTAAGGLTAPTGPIPSN